MTAKTAKTAKAFKTVQARRAQQTLAAVATVRPSSSGIAACTPHRDLFDEAGSDRAPTTVRIEAAGICARCSFAGDCGFRVAMPAVDSRTYARARSRARDRTS
ncbi:hypothetical protein [Streptomyces kasugaensis]|uniref:hypothetical protein n=1 Tax=Streptomyces kasugaensis TaxID=1946 RepID=UPI001A942FE8|nr:hypothetical protein [Streptomyces kasugaensis]